jgi:two-component system, OmpR family, response regulator
MKGRLVAHAHEHKEPPVAGFRRPRLDPEPTVLEADGVRLDLGTMALWVDGRRVDITMQELLLLKLLMESGGRVLRGEDLLDRAWGPDRGRMSNTMSVLLYRLRRKLLRPDGSSRIRTVRNVGYAFDASR